MKRTYILIIVLFFLVILLGIISILSFLQPRTQSSQSNVLPSPTPIIYSIPKNVPKKQINPSIPAVFKPNETKKMLDLLENRRPLSATDAKIKTKLINSVNGDTQNITTNNEFLIDYIQPLDEFQVRINILDINKAKKDAVAWFISQGMTADGVCKLPVTFYLEYSILQQAKEQGIQFSPIPEGC